MTSADKSKNSSSTANGHHHVCSKHGKQQQNHNVKVSKHNHRNLEISRCRHHNNNNNNNSNNSNSNNNHNDINKITNLRPSHHRKSESVLSTDSHIRFTRRKLKDSQKFGCIVIAGFLVALLLASIFVYLGYTYLRPEPLPERIFRGKFRVTQGDKWSMDLANQNSIRFQHKARDYRERINLVIKRSDLRNSYDGSEILALDGKDELPDLLVLFILKFDPYRGLVSTADLLAIFNEEIASNDRKYFANITVEPSSLEIKEITGALDETELTPASPLEREDIYETTLPPPIPRYCEPVKLDYCKTIGYNVTTYPNLLGHMSIEEVKIDLIAFRELVDAECFREAYDFICRMLQPPCLIKDPYEPQPGLICREYCQSFMKSCENRIVERFRQLFDCENFPESTGVQSCWQKPRCMDDLRSNSFQPRICDGIADCPDLSDEKSCSFCPSKSIYCGRGRACVPKTARCDGNNDCPDGADEKDCLSVAPLTTDLDQPNPIIPYLPKFYSEGFAIFSEKGKIGKLCAEGLESKINVGLRQTVAESLCKSLGYDTLSSVEIRNDSEKISDYVRVLDPHAAEISFVRTSCHNKEVLYVTCSDLQCGVQSVLSPKHILLPKMASPGDWPWFVSLYREETHVCDGTLISADWVLTTESCFQGQPRATWLAIFGSVRLKSNPPWKQRRRIIGMVKSPVEGSTAALVRLETPVHFSDFVRPICLPDEIGRKLNQNAKKPDRKSNKPKAEKLNSQNRESTSSNVVRSTRISPKERREFFLSPYSYDQSTIKIRSTSEPEDDTEATVIKEIPVAEPLKNPDALSDQNLSNKTEILTQPTSEPLSYTKPPYRHTEQVWTNCNTLGWSRQKEHLQRVQLKIGDMALCENVSIATVNSMCTEATFHVEDCAEEEFAGSPVHCLIPDTNQWAIVGISSWRIGCGPTGVERPRMYDKITSNSAWIRDTINAL
ncbi:uncharacterized protein LOC129619000 [Condylostylus longicornis]|uniref:uncharacterized protein LOC129619000 n=1 Tax=Condylostylus longicornis TaxID=2530218 RepID=UPI00244E21A0|nr:uncharacterized protein LOC129619000 [Condylostylus longicornis]